MVPLTIILLGLLCAALCGCSSPSPETTGPDGLAQPTQPPQAQIVDVQVERHPFGGRPSSVYYVLVDVSSSRSARLATARRVLGTALRQGAQGDVFVRFVDDPAYARWRAAPLGAVAFRLERDGAASSVTAADCRLEPGNLTKTGGQRPTPEDLAIYDAWVGESRQAAAAGGRLRDSVMAAWVADKLGVSAAEVRSSVRTVEQWIRH